MLIWKWIEASRESQNKQKNVIKKRYYFKYQSIFVIFRGWKIARVNIDLIVYLLVMLENNFV